MSLLSSLPPIFVLPTNLSADDIHDVEDLICENGGQLSYEPTEAKIFLGRVSQKKRAAFELRKRGVWTVECPLPASSLGKKRKRHSELTMQTSEASDTESDEKSSQPSAKGDLGLVASSLQHHVMVLKLDWLNQSVKSDKLLPYQSFLIYSGCITQEFAEHDDSTKPDQSSITYIKASPANTTTNNLTVTAAIPKDKIEALANEQKSLEIMKSQPRRFRDQKYSNRTSLRTTHPGLHRTTTSEHDFIKTKGTSPPANLPGPPSWQLEAHPRPNYACLRSTFADSPNSQFLSHLYKIKESRILTLDEIGVRAYSTSIASISAYQHLITSPSEITRLPGCSDRIATLWLDWWNSSPDNPEQRTMSVTEALDKDEDLKILKLFYGIWGVGAETARKFYYEHGWKDLDDVVEFGWNSGALNRVQQIGLKFYDDFEKKIPRKEVEEIADVVLRHARLSRQIPKEWWSNPNNDHRGNWSKPDNGHGDKSWDSRDMVCVIVGGYRRGKTECGDVDVILSHRDEEYTRDLVVDVVASLETEEYITHTLSLHTTNTDRDQQTLPFRDKGHSGHGFDTLDKALCVWQDPAYDRTRHEKNPNVRRRVDIIVSPWRTIGAAVLGWSGATTFERDIRRWCRKEKGWKFDSSGVRDRGSGAVLDFETPRSVVGKGKGDKGKKSAIRTDDGDGGSSTASENGDDEDGDSWEDRERRLMEGLGIGWRPAIERCTG